MLNIRSKSDPYYELWNSPGILSLRCVVSLKDYSKLQTCTAYKSTDVRYYLKVRFIQHIRKARIIHVVLFL